MKVNEKTLELNLGAEILTLVRPTPGHGKAYLRGLTQSEEKQQGIDFFLTLPSGARLFLFQFKAPLTSSQCPPFKYMLKREQHEKLQASTGTAKGLAFYVFPYYLNYQQLHAALPVLASDTWLLDVADIPLADFKTFDSRTVSCAGSTARINPEYPLRPLTTLAEGGTLGPGVTRTKFEAWYRGLRRPRDDQRSGRRSPWLVRGLRALVVLP